MDPAQEPDSDLLRVFTVHVLHVYYTGITSTELLDCSWWSHIEVCLATYFSKKRSSCPRGHEVLEATTCQMPPENQETPLAGQTHVRLGFDKLYLWDAEILLDSPLVEAHLRPCASCFTRTQKQAKCASLFESTSRFYDNTNVFKTWYNFYTSVTCVSP